MDENKKSNIDKTNETNENNLDSTEDVEITEGLKNTDNLDNITIDDVINELNKKLNKEASDKDNTNSNNDNIDTDIDKNNEELLKLMEEISKKIDGKKEFTIIESTPKMQKKFFLLKIFKPLISLLILVALTGYIDWITYEKFYLVLFPLFTIAILHFSFESMIEKFGFKLILKTLGLIKYAYAPIAFTVSCLVFALFIPLVKFPNIGLLLLVLIIYIFVRNFIVQTMQRMIIE